MLSDEDPEDDQAGDHNWHWRYNRRLSCFQHMVTSLCFSQDGHWLVSGTGSGDVKIWDTGCWAEAAKLKGCRHEEPRALVISPAQRWLVCAHSSTMNIYQGQPPWRLEYSMPAPHDPMTKEPSEWCCIAFSPLAEVDHPGGHAGQDNHLATFASNVLCVLDYSGGWSFETPRRTRSLFNTGRPTSIVYTACGWWVVCGYEGGTIQIWNHFSLTLERTLAAHTGIVNAISASPRCASYDARFLSCGVDHSMRVWHSSGWTLEQIVPDTGADRNGVRYCTFSDKGNWVVSVASELCVWRVCVSLKGKLELRLHQRLAAVCGAEGLRAAAFCSQQDAIAVGSRDGVLGLWTKLPGMPPEPVKESNRGVVRTKSDPTGGVAAWIMDRPLPRPMMHVKPEERKETPDLGDERRSLQNSEWFVRSDLRSLKRTASIVCGNGTRKTLAGSLRVNATKRDMAPSPVTPNIRAKLMASRERTQKVHDADASPTDEGDAGMERSRSIPGLRRWTSTEFEDVLSAYCNGAADGGSSPSSPKKLSKTLPPGFFSKQSTERKRSMALVGSGGRAGALGFGGAAAGDDQALSNETSSVRKTLVHASKLVAQRISLDPQSIC